MAVVPIETERATLRPVAEQDLRAVHAILGDEQTTADVSWRQPDLQSTARWIEKRIAQERAIGLSMWAVERRDTGEVIGLCGYFPHELPEIELGYVIRSDYWGQGWASEVVPAVLHVATNEGLRVFATIRSTNMRSLAVAHRVGLVERGSIDDDRGRLLLFRSEPAPSGE